MCAGSDQQLIEARHDVGAVVEIADLNRPGIEVDPRYLVADADVDRLFLAELLWLTDDQRIDVVYDLADEVRDAAGRVRGVMAALECEDLELVGSFELACLRSRAHPRGVPADDHESL